MSSNPRTDPLAEAAESLRSAAADLIARAEVLEQEAERLRVPEPLEPATDEQEAEARLVALDLSSSGVNREEAERQLAEQFPAVDRAPLLERFFPG